MLKSPSTIKYYYKKKLKNAHLRFMVSDHTRISRAPVFSRRFVASILIRMKEKLVHKQNAYI